MTDLHRKSLFDAKARQEAAIDAMANGRFFDTAGDLMKVGNYRDALPLLLQARSLAQDRFPDWGSSPAIEVCVGECFEKLGQAEEARQAFNQALSIMEPFTPEKKNAFNHLIKRATDGLARLK